MSSLHTQRYRRFLEKLRAARAEAGMSQTQVAAHLNRSQGWVTRSECGERRIDAAEFVDLCKLYKKPPRFFFPELPAERGK